MTTRPPSACPPSPLWAILCFSFLASIGTGIVTNGIFFLTKSAYGFGPAANYRLAAFLGITYIVSALLAGPLFRRLRERTGLSSRAGLAGVSILCGLSALLPGASRLIEGPDRAAVWSLWALLAVYSPLTGLLWPMAESFVSGGRSGEKLRGAIGRFNVVWSSAVALAYWLMGPFVERQPEALLSGLGVVQILTAILLGWVHPEPGEHLPHEHEPHPAVYVRLLATFRVLIVASYAVMTALTPYLPTLLGNLGAAAWLTPILASSWLLARVVVFRVMERRHGWHGRWAPVVVGVSALFGGFGLTVLSDRLAGGATGIALAMAGLASFGAGMATIYSAALYYAMEVGKAEVDAGGMHEALIGGGYTIGPVVGVLACATVPPGDVDVTVLGAITVLMILAGGIALRMSARAVRELRSSG